MNTIGIEIIERLQEHASLHGLASVAAEGIRKWLANGEAEPLPGGVSPNHVTWHFASRWLCFEPESFPDPFIDTRFTLFKDDQRIGYYRLITLLDGETYDDYFVLEPKIA